MECRDLISHRSERLEILHVYSCILCGVAAYHIFSIAQPISFKSILIDYSYLFFKLSLNTEYNDCNIKNFGFHVPYAFKYY